MKQKINQSYLMTAILIVLAVLLNPSVGMAKVKNLDKAKSYCSNAGFTAQKCSECGKKNSKNCECCYKKKPFWCPKGLAKAPTSYGLYKVCIEGKKSKAVLRDLSKVKNAAITLNPTSITKAYDIYFGWVASGVTVKKQKLSSETIKKYQPFYKADLSKVRVGESKRVASNTLAITNCKTIWFPDGSGMVANPEQDVETLTHELQHYEQCMNRGGKRRYAKMWFGQLGTTLIKSILNGKSGDLNGINLHGAMPMEKDAFAKEDEVKKGLGLS